MKTKFSPIVKAKKNMVDVIERELINLNFKINSTKESINSITNSIYELNIPKNGNFMELLQVQSYKEAYMSDLEMRREDLAFYINQREKVVNSLKDANLELEKMKHLEELEVQKKLKKLKLAESQELDEISVMLYNNKRESL